MRGSQRIKPFMKEIERYWKAHPDMRFGQIVSDVIVHAHNSLYYIEDHHFLEELKKFERDVK